MDNKGKTQNLWVRRYHPEWATHLPILTKIMNISEGPVLELGMGIHSTPLLHALCQDQKRLLESYDDSEKWVNSHWTFEAPHHKIGLATDWDKVPIEKQHWGIIFIDHTTSRRNIEAGRASQFADYVILHDSNPRNDSHFHYSTIYHLYKYQYNYKRLSPNTTILSNFKDLSNL